VPYCLDPYTLETLGPETMGGALKLGALAAHFRIDADKQVNNRSNISHKRFAHFIERATHT